MNTFLFFLLSIFSLYSYEVLFFGDAVVDYTVLVDDDFMQNLPGKLGGASPVDIKTFQMLSKDYVHKCAGGGCTNTAKGLSLFGHSCALTGWIGNDMDANNYRTFLAPYDVQLLFSEYDVPTARVCCLVSPDGHRTMRSHITSLNSLENFSLDEEIFKGITIFHVEGYQLPYISHFKPWIQQAKKENALISLDMGCFELADRYREEVLDLLPGHIDILFCNSDEAKMLTGLEPRRAALFLSQFCKIAVVMMGADGGFVASEDDLHYYFAKKALLVDDTGAGDLFIAGFFHGLLQGESLDVCADIGAEVAAKVVQVTGTDLPKETWAELIALENAKVSSDG